VNRVVADASVLAAIAFVEPQGATWARQLNGAAVFAPRLLHYELQNVARKKCEKAPAKAVAILSALALVLSPDHGITWADPDPVDVVLLAGATGLTTYDATYLCLAAMLGADLVTADRKLAGAADSFAG
jgi:predicted nucleic acid-binding protein